MEENEPMTIGDAIHRVQLVLLEGIDSEDKLFAAGSLMSRSDYQDVVTERTIAKACGYPLCNQLLPAERARKGRYRISLKEHKVYDLHETYLYCSTGCVINSRTFAASLPDERCCVLNSKKLNNVLKLFERKSLETEKGLETEGDFGMSKLKIQENEDASVAGVVPLEEWIGPSNAIEGYVPQNDQMLKSSQRDQQKGVSKKTKANKEKRVTFNETEFRSTIITSEEYTTSKPARTSSQLFNEIEFDNTLISSDEYTISKPSPSSSSQMIDHKAKLKGGRKGKTAKKEMENQFTLLDNQSGSMLDGRKAFSKEPKQEKHVTSDPQLEIVSANISGVKEESDDVKATSSSAAALKSCLKSAGENKASQSVRWHESIGNSNQPKVRELQSVKESSENVMSSSGEVNGDELRCASAEACARALTEAAEAISSGEIDVSDALTEAGIIVLPYPDTIEPEQAPPTKLLKKPGVPNYNLFESEDSWYDSTPEGFSLTLSSFATMWMALFAWTSSSSLAFIYGRNEDDHEDFATVNGREYPQKIVLSEGRSSEIKQTLSGCLARALPGVITDLRLSTPVSTLEKELGRLLETMSFVDPLPGFRMKQWRVIVFLFIEVLSVSRIPALTTHLTNRRIFLNKVLDGAQISVEEYENMKELMIPLGRVPEFSMQSGG